MMPREPDAGTKTTYAANLISYGDPLLTTVKKPFNEFCPNNGQYIHLWFSFSNLLMILGL
jgi:hypothetical protein